MDLTLSDINQKLTGLGFPAMTGEQARELCAKVNREKFLNTMAGASAGNALALRQIIKDLAQIGIQARPAQALAGSPANETNNAASAQGRPHNTPAPTAGGEEQEGLAGEEKATRDYSRQIRVSTSGGVVIFEPAFTNDQKTQRTIMIEAARPFPNASRGKPKKGEKRYDYSHKILFKVMDNELPQLAAFLYGHCASVEFAFHGEDNSKAVRLEWQQNPSGARNIFAKVREKGILVAVPMQVTVGVHLAMLVASVLLERYPGVSDASLSHLLAMHGAQFEAKPEEAARKTG